MPVAHRTESGFLVLADISGFTAFVTATELEHGAEVTGVLLADVMAALSPPLEIQELELRRVERDLHDGAQARLVSLGISLGLAEQMLEADPAQAKRLLTDARSSAGAALSDLRDLVRGIHPPVLADRV